MESFIKKIKFLEYLKKFLEYLKNFFTNQILNLFQRENFLFFKKILESEKF
jgi:hypothetical protein